MKPGGPSLVNLIATLALVFCATAGAQQQFPELIPIPTSEQISTMREPLPLDTLIEAALAFSGSAEPALSSAKDKLVASLHRFKAETADITGQAELAEKALTFLHASLLKNYSLLQTRVDTALETGGYNCVSSAVLYMIFARAVDLSVGGIRTTDHAFCTVWVNGTEVDVETTNPFGFNPGAKKEFFDTFGKVTGFTYVPSSSNGDRRKIGEKDLLSLILYNRVSAYTESRYFRDALEPAVSAYVLTGTDETRKLLDTALSNYVSWLGMRQQYSQALRFIDMAKASFGTAIDLERRKGELLHDWIVTLAEGGSLEEARTLLEQASARESLGDSDWADLAVYVVESSAQAAARAEGFLAAAGIVAEGIRRIGAKPELLQEYEAYVHNAFAQLFNARRFAEAKAVVEQGQALSPGSRVLAQDLETVKRAQR